VPTIVEWLDRDIHSEAEGEGGGSAGAAASSSSSGSTAGSAASSSSSSSSSGIGMVSSSEHVALLQRACAHYPSVPAYLLSCSAALGLLRPSGLCRLRILAAAGVLLAVHLLHAQMYAMARFDYNAVNRFTEWVPIATFLILRNLTPSLRSVHLRLFAWLGEMSLELYILQFHVWMAEDAKKLVVLFPDFRGVSFLLATFAFVLFAWASSAVTGLAMKHIEAQGRNAVLGAAGGLLVVLCAVNAMPRSCSVGGAGGR
jgi:hypothetical protein